MAYELNKKIVIDTEEFNNFAVGITLPIQRWRWILQNLLKHSASPFQLKKFITYQKGERILQLILEVG